MAKIKILLFLAFLIIQLNCSNKHKKTDKDVFSYYPAIVLKNNLQNSYDLAKLSVYVYHYNDICIETQYGNVFSPKPLGLLPLTLDTLEVENDTILFHFKFEQDSLICVRAINKQQPTRKSDLVIMVVAISASSNTILYAEKSSSIIMRDRGIDFHACLLKAIEDIKEDSLIVNPWLLKEIKKQVEYSQ
jgi:hypothetical protein